jgi:hypothetical protein
MSDNQHTGRSDQYMGRRLPIAVDTQQSHMAVVALLPYLTI